MKALLAIDGSHGIRDGDRDRGQPDLAARFPPRGHQRRPDGGRGLRRRVRRRRLCRGTRGARAAASTTADAGSMPRPSGCAGRVWPWPNACSEGRAATVILEEAERTSAELIIVGARDHGAIERVLLGSVSAEVVDHAHCPVLVARRPTAWRVLVATDGSPDAALRCRVRRRVRPVRRRRRPDRERDRRARGLVARVHARRRDLGHRCLRDRRHRRLRTCAVGRRRCRPSPAHPRGWRPSRSSARVPRRPRSSPRPSPGMPTWSSSGRVATGCSSACSWAAPRGRCCITRRCRS